MLRLYNRKNKKHINLFTKVALFAFSFAWLACTSHFSFVSPIVDKHTQSDHGDESTTHTASCLDHTYQISARNQGNSFSGDLSTFVIPSPIVAFDFSMNSVSVDKIAFYQSDQDVGRYLFLEHTVLRL